MIVNSYSNLKIYLFLIKDYNIKIFLLLIFIKAIISRLLLSVIILSLNIKERDRRLIDIKSNTFATSIRL